MLEAEDNEKKTSYEEQVQKVKHLFASLRLEQHKIIINHSSKLNEEQYRALKIQFEREKAELKKMKSNFSLFKADTTVSEETHQLSHK